MFSHLLLEDSLADLWEPCALIGWPLDHQVEDSIWELTDKWDSLLDPIPNSTVSKFKSLTFIYLIPGVVNSISIYRTGGKFTYFLSWAGPPAGPLAFRCDTMPEYYVL